MTYTNFQVGEKFPLPIQTPGDGGLFQYDINGAMFILKLSKTDVIAVEAFRTGKMELALFEENGLAFFLYQIDGIFKQGWGDCPYSVEFINESQRPDLSKTADPAIHLYLVDSQLDVLLAMRRVDLNEDFAAKLQSIAQTQLAAPQEKSAYAAAVQKIWQTYSSAQMREKAIAVQSVPLAIPVKPPITSPEIKH